MSYDRYAAQAAPPVSIRNALIVDDIVNELNQKLDKVPEGDRARVEVLRWLMLYLEHRVNEEKAGSVRKEVVVRLLGRYYRNPDQLGDMIDFICSNGLVKKRNLLVRLFQVASGFIRFKLL